MFKLHSLGVAIGLWTLSACHFTTPKEYDKAPPGTQAKAQDPQLALASAHVTQHHIAQGSSFYQTLRALGFESQTILDLVACAKPLYRVQDVGAGTAFAVTWSSPAQKEALKLELRFAADSSLVMERSSTDLEWTARQVQLPVTVQTRTFNGVVATSLWESADIVGMDPSLISHLAEVFAWQIDFNRAVQKGDRWRLTVEEKRVHDQTIGWGHILVAEYENDGQTYTGIRYPQQGEPAAYYAPNGQSLRRMFLKSPIKYGRITSGFSHSRFHPILRVNRPHNGVDYGAPAGTPVMTVGKGEITYLGYNGGSGKMIRIRHNSTYQTAYLHLQGYAKGLRVGSTVEQGQVIGYVGSTGLATGPHLHFAFYEQGRYVDPLGLKFPSADPIAADQLPEFQRLVASMMQTLPDWQLAEHRSQDADKYDALPFDSQGRPIHLVR